LPFRILEIVLSGTTQTLRMIEQTSARLCKGIGGLAEPRHDAPGERGGTVPSAPWLAASEGKAPADPACRVKLLRAAWGPDENKALSSAYLRSLATGQQADVAVDPAGLEDNCVFPPPVGRIVLNLLLLAAESMPSGGTITLAGSADDLFLRIAGRGAAWPTGMAACIADEAVAIVAMTGGDGAQMPLTALLAHASGIRLSFLLSASSRTEPPMLRLGGG
jgi:hypothetical protein